MAENTARLARYNKKGIKFHSKLHDKHRGTYPEFDQDRADYRFLFLNCDSGLAEVMLDKDNNICHVGYAYYQYSNNYETLEFDCTSIKFVHINTNYIAAESSINRFGLNRLKDLLTLAGISIL